MKIVRLSQSIILFASVFNFVSPAWATVKVDESDAMQITTHFNDLTGVACDNTAQYCVAVGVINHPEQIDHVVYTTNNGGVKWSQGYTLTHPDNEDRIEEPKNSGQAIMQIRCDASGQNCLIAGSTQIANQSKLMTYTSHDGGLTWSTPTLLSYPEPQKQTLTEDYPFLRLKCNANNTDCVLISNTMIDNQAVPAIFTTQNGGETWSSSQLNMPLNSDDSTQKGIQLLDLGCDQTGVFCTALANTTFSNEKNMENNFLPESLIYSTHDSGLTWSDAKSLVLTPNAYSDSEQNSNRDVLRILSCDRSTGLRCIALGARAVIDEHQNISTTTHAYLTKNGGLSWQDTTEISASDATHTNVFTALNCDVNNRFCSAVGMSVDEDGDKDFPIIYTSIDGGLTWQKKAFTPPNGALSLMLDVFCSDDAAFCHAVGVIL